MATSSIANRNNFVRWKKITGAFLLGELEAYGVPGFSSPASIPTYKPETRYDDVEGLALTAFQGESFDWYANLNTAETETNFDLWELALVNSDNILAYSNFTPLKMDLRSFTLGTSGVDAASPESNLWQGVTFGNDLFVAVSSDGATRVQTSPDGVTWTARAAAEANAWTDVTFGNNLFVAVSSDGTNRVQTSPDGITWTARAAAEANAWIGITFGNDLFVAVSLGGTNQIQTSPDGITWSARVAAAANTWQELTFGNNLFVAVGVSAGVMSSPDGITWTSRTASEFISWIGITFGNDLFVAVGASGTNRVMTSPDGITWTSRVAASQSDWKAITFGDGVFVSIDNANEVGMYSSDGITWTGFAIDGDGSWEDVTYGNGNFIGVADAGTDRVFKMSLSPQYNFYSQYTVNDIAAGCYRMVIHDENNLIKYISNKIKFSNTIAPFSYKIRYRNAKNILNFDYETLTAFYNQFRIDLFIRQPKNQTNRIGYDLISGAFNPVRTVTGTVKEFLAKMYNAEDHAALNAATIHKTFEVFEDGSFVKYERGEGEQSIEWLDNYPLADGSIELERNATFSSNDNV
jgi:hypothetical protein